jgi:hypothetical protein
LHIHARLANVIRNQALRKVADMEFGTIEREIHIDASPRSSSTW